MKVSDLKKLLADVPEGLTEEEFNDLPVMISDDGVFGYADVGSSGHSTADCHDDQGNGHYPVSFFGVCSADA